MYTSFHIQNFRGFADLELTDLGRINLIAGKNNVGKTALLEALFLHAGGKNTELVLRIQKFRGLSIEPSLWETIFNDTKYPIFLDTLDESHTARKVELELIHQREDIASIIEIKRQENNQPFQETLGQTTVSEISNIIKWQFYENGNPSDSLFLIPNRQNIYADTPFPVTIAAFHSMRQRFINESVQQFTELVKQSQESLLINWLKILEPRLKTIFTLPDANGQTIFWAEAEHRRLPLSVMGDGLANLNDVFLKITALKDGVLLIDEIENGLHYSVMEQVWKAVGEAARQFNVQIFATTHSLEMIRAAHEAFKGTDDFRYHRLDRLNDGTIKANTYEDEVIDASIEMNVEVR